MSIIDFIENSRKEGLTDDQIIQEIKKKYPEKEKSLNEAKQRNASSKKIIEEIIRQNPKPVLEGEKGEESDKTKKIEEARRRIEGLKKSELTKPQGIEEGDFKPKTKEEILDEFLKRKIASEGTEGGGSSEGLRGPEAKIPLGEVIKPLPKKQGMFKRFLIRFLFFGLVLIVLAGIILFWLWYFVWQIPQGKCTDDSMCEEGYICASGACQKAAQKCSSDSECQNDYFCDNGSCKKTGISANVSPSFFTPDIMATLEISSLEEISALLTQKSQEWLNADNFKRIAFVDKNNSKEIELKEFFSSIFVKAPDAFFQKLENNFMFFVHAPIQGNRIGFIAKIKNPEGFSALLKSAEPAMENNFKSFLDLVSTQDTYIQNRAFKDSSAVKGYAGPNFRYKVLTNNDFGIYYLVALDKNYFIFTTSWRSMEKIINKLGLVAINP